MSEKTHCLIARSAVVALRKRGQEPKLVTLVFPARWRRSQLLGYVRREHPGETARIVEWHESHEGWSPKLWLVNPKAFADFHRGLPA